MARERKQPARKTDPGRIEPWPAQAEGLAEVAAKVRYLGSAEHKSYPTAATGGPGLRHAEAGEKDASLCPYYPDERWPDIEAALQAAIRAGCVGVPEQGFPRKVWGYFEGQLHEARQTNPGYGQYKGYPAATPPLDKTGRLEELRHELGLQS